MTRKQKKMLGNAEAVAKLVDKFAPEMQQLSDVQLQSKTEELKAKLTGKQVEEILPEAFAVVREVADRVLGQRHYFVQIVCGYLLHQGVIAEMQTGEGKTLAATLPSYVHALGGGKTHIVTPNAYLAKRDAEAMGKVFSFLGLTTAVIEPSMSPAQRADAYRADVVYVSGNELGFDFLRNNLAQKLEQRIQGERSFVIIDEVDLALIDEARIPMVLSAPAPVSRNAIFAKAQSIAEALGRGDIEDSRDHFIGSQTRKHSGDFTVDEKTKIISLTEAGIERIEEILGVQNLYEGEGLQFVQAVNLALMANHLYLKDRDYVVQDGQIVLIDQRTGRLAPGSSLPGGLHQAVEAKEELDITPEVQKLASMTVQNFYLSYDKVSGMSGTAALDAEEYENVYGLNVVVIPTRLPSSRKVHMDLIYQGADARLDAAVRDIADRNSKGQPVLVGTVSVAASEIVSAALTKAGVPHEVLSAKNHAREAEIIANAGCKGAVTIATNMAGRGTDIVLGKTPDEHAEVVSLGGLYVVGIERQETRRLDDQLIGRCARQGDPGECRFYLSLEDALLRIFGSEQISSVVEMAKVPKEMPLENKMLGKVIRQAQQQVASFYFSIRKELIEYDEVVDKQRNVIYHQRDQILLSGSIESLVSTMASAEINRLFQDPNVEISEIEQEVVALFGFKPEVKGMDKASVDHLKGQVAQLLQDKFAAVPIGVARQVMKQILLSTIDKNWCQHLAELDYLRDGMALRAYAQKNLKESFKKDAHDLFMEMSSNIRNQVLRDMFRVCFQVNKEAV